MDHMLENPGRGLRIALIVLGKAAAVLLSVLIYLELKC